MTTNQDAISRLQAFGVEVASKIQSGEFPAVEIPDRNTSNIVYDTKLEQYVLGPKKSRRESANIRHVHSFAQLTWVAAFAKDLLISGRTSSLRDLYYSSEAYGLKFKDQPESNRVVSDLECLLDMSREDFGIFPEEHSSIYGEVIMEYTVSGYEGRKVDLTVSPDGLPIGRALMTAKPVSTNAKIILAVESGGMFSRLIETESWKDMSAVLVHLGGQAPRSTRRLLKCLHTELNLPVYVFTDGDPWGMHIARVIMSGSANAAHVKGLSIPTARWIGVTAADIKKHNLPTEDMSDYDLRRLDELTNDIRYSSEFWQNQIHKFKQLRKKAEQQAFSRHGIDYVVDSYLTDKLSAF